ncbi:MAG: hypothetical protein O3A51_02890, partial [Verrucomicrobia bacterium]|nr:hypothetical protein [Verrucomicrobiota bacterium]
MNDDCVTVTISDVGYRGKGVARHDGLVHFVDGVLPGERVVVRPVKQRKNCVETTLVEILEPSVDRIVPACELAGSCPGCTYQHVSYPAELALKHQQLISLLERIGGCVDVVCREPVASPQPLGYRNKIVVHAERRDESLKLGYVGGDNRQIVDVPACPLAVDPLNAELKRWREAPEKQALLKHGVSVVMRASTSGTVLS